MSRMFQAACWLMLVIWIVAVAVQYNDPDPLLWMAIYALPAVLTTMALRNRYTLLAAVAAVGYFAGFFYWMPDTPGSWLDIEEGREAFGLLLCAFWMIVLMVKRYRQRSEVSVAPEAGEL